MAAAWNSIRDQRGKAGVAGVGLHTLAALCLAMVAALLFAAETAAQPSRWTADEWVDDLDYLRVRIRSSHVNPFHALEGGQLQAGFEKLREDIPTLTDFEIAFAMQRLVASLGDGHSWLAYYEKDLTRYFPFRAYEFTDGFYITHGTRGHDDLAGARIVAIDGKPIAAVRAALRPYVSRDNEMDVLRQMPLLVQQPTALHAAGITRHRDRAEFTLILPRGDEVRSVLNGMPADQYRRWHRAVREPDDAPLYRRKMDDHYWYQELAGERALYFQFNAFHEKPDESFDDFVRDLFAYLDAQAIDCLIIDARHNDGGQTRLLDPLLDQILRHPRLQKRGHLYMITGRETFSSSLMLAVRLERATEVIFAGEPGTGKPNSYSEFGPFTLPNTGLRGSLSALFHQESDPLDPRSKVDVDLPAPLTYDDYRDNRDPSLDAVLAHWRSVRS